MLLCGPHRHSSTGYLAKIERNSVALWQAVTVDAQGRETAAALGNGLTTNRTFDPFTGRMMASSLLAPDGTARLSEGYIYDLLGNVTNRTQYWNGAGFMEDFTYDDLHRLATSKLNGVVQTYLYDDAGSILSKTGIGTGNYIYLAQGTMPCVRTRSRASSGNSNTTTTATATRRSRRGAPHRGPVLT